MRVLIALVVSLVPLVVLAQGDVGGVKPVPPVGKEIAAADRAELEAGVAKLGKEIDELAVGLRDRPELFALLPDVRVYYNAVRYGLIYNEFMDAKNDVKNARQALADGEGRVAQLKAGKPEWIYQSGPRGYVSRIDRSVQPYVLLVPEGFGPGDKGTKYRFDFWCHGRGEDLMELKFLRSKDQGAKDHFVVNLYGRYCNANKFAGEIDLLEVLEDVKRRYPVDERRLVDIGFSMGGAAAWQFAVHYTDLFAAASPGAGFSESREFLRIKPEEVEAMAQWERSLWHWYDCTDYAANLYNLPTVAYAGEIDGQKQASDAMERAMAAEGLKLERFIGPKTGHKYEPETKKKLDARLAEICAKGREAVPGKVRFTTWTLRYDRMFWVRVDRMGRHWERARVDAEISGPTSINVTTDNVAAMTIDIPGGDGSRLPADAAITVTIDGRKLNVATHGGRGLHVYFEKWHDGWSIPVDSLVPPTQLHKRHGLQGPIDDAFMDSFVIVRPTGKGANEKTSAWAASEMEHAIAHWRKQFRGEARVVNDTELTEADVRESNLVCFGDASSNSVIGRAAKGLPVKWEGGKVVLGEKSFDGAHHVPVLVYPNPLNPSRYMVLNSGFTFREFDYLNNARQTPKLPDYAVIDVDSPVTAKAPGKVVEAGFFDERWGLGR